MKVLVVKIVEQSHEELQNSKVFRDVLKVYDIVDQIFSKFKKEIMQLVAYNDNLTV